MPEKPTAPEREPLSAHELPELLLWLFNTTGHFQHVEAWRAAKERAADERAAARKKD